jgi:hypothetical protein
MSTGLALSSLRVSQQIVEERDLASPRDEGRRMLASVNESVDSPRVVSRRTAHGFEKKPPVEDVSAGCGRDDRITRRRGHQSIEDGMDRATRIGVELDAIVEASDQDFVSVQRGVHR